MNKDKELNRIARYLMLHECNVLNIGLLRGKMGICIFFYHYARNLNDELYQLFADELMNEIYILSEKSHLINFSDGLLGVAWGIEYLVKNDFIEADTDDILQKIDNQVFERDILRITDLSINSGLRGIAYYALARCGNELSKFGGTNNMYLRNLLIRLGEIEPDAEIHFLQTQLHDFLEMGKIPLSHFFLEHILKNILYNDNDIWKGFRPIGIIDNGFTGIALNLLNLTFNK